MAATSRSHLDDLTEDFLSRLPLAKRYLCGSSVKFCHLAQGDADLYPRLSPTHEWDIAAGCAILTAAGGVVTDPQGGDAALRPGGQPVSGARLPGLGRSGQGGRRNSADSRVIHGHAWGTLASVAAVLQS